jgi:hypothetical protein
MRRPTIQLARSGVWRRQVPFFFKGVMSDNVDDVNGHHAAGASRGVVLVASTSRIFSEIVGAMVTESGYTPAFAAQNEPVWRSVARTRPGVVICDCDGPVQTRERLVAESTTRRIPILMSTLANGSTSTSVPPGVRGVGVLALPASREEFSAALAAVFRPETPIDEPGRATVSGATGFRSPPPPAADDR